MEEKDVVFNAPVPDMTDMDEVRKAVIASEILNRKY